MHTYKWIMSKIVILSWDEFCLLEGTMSEDIFGCQNCRSGVLLDSSG